MARASGAIVRLPAGKPRSEKEVAKPVHDLDSEIGVLGSLLMAARDPDYRHIIISVIAKLQPADFFIDAHQVIFRHLVELYRTKRIDPTLLVDRLKASGEYQLIGGSAYLSKICDTPNCAHADYYADNVKEYSTRRGYIAHFEEGLRKARDHAPLNDLGELVASFHQSEEEAKRKASGDTSIPLEHLIDMYPELRAPIIEGFLREGETMNLIAAPKVGKSWLAYDLALSIATGRKWFGHFETHQRNVLYLDNELDRPLIASRFATVAAARGIDRDEWRGHLHIEPLRGRLRNIYELGDEFFSKYRPGQHQVIVIDAFYRVLPGDLDENKNGDMTRMYNMLDQWSAKLGCAFIPVHHSSKGNQSSKGVTDVGSGAGAMSRAADTHVVIRQHDENGAAVMDAAVRSWPKVAPVCLRWNYPIWEADLKLDPADLKRERTKGKSRDAKPANEWTAARFAAECVPSDRPSKRGVIEEKAIELGVHKKDIPSLLRRAKDNEHIFEWPSKAGFSRTKPPKGVIGGDAEPSATKKDLIEAAIRSNPKAKDDEIAASLGCGRQYVSRIRKELSSSPD